jgi:F0F1-type ATP synthase epsilon subunit
MILHVVSALKKQDIAIAWFEINSRAGNFVIQPGHAPMIVTLMANSVITYGLEGGGQESQVIKQGIVHVTRADITLLASE